MRKILTVARKEFLETASTKTFLLGLFVGPLTIIAGTLMMGQIGQSVQTMALPDKKIAIVDNSGELLSRFETFFETYNQKHPNRRIVLEATPETSGDETSAEELKRLVRERILDGVLVIPRDVVTTVTQAPYYTRGADIGDERAFRTAWACLNEAVVGLRCELYGISPEIASRIRGGVAVEKMDVKAGTTQKPVDLRSRLIVPAFFLLLMFVGMLVFQEQLLTSIVEEKNSRVIEVILSAVTPFDFMAGKVLGLTAVGLIAVTTWGLTAYVAALFTGLAHLVPVSGLLYFFIYFILGFILFASMFAAAGSACNTFKEAQNLFAPIVLMISMPVAGGIYFALFPECAWAVALSYVPPLTPFVMTVRLAAQPDLPRFQVYSTILLLVLSVPIVVWASARIFRTGILMYGKTPTPGELIRWMRSG